MATSFMITGQYGQLGRWLRRRIEAAPDLELRLASDVDELDITNRDAVMRSFDDLPAGPPDVVVNAAAYTAVDACETDLEAASAVNGAAPGLLAELCCETGARLVHVSTDYVFAGNATTPYRESDTPDPRTAYGRTKLDGERRVLGASTDFWIVRTSWVFGPGKNFVGAILRQAILRRLGKVEGPLRVVDDQLGCPTYAADLADGILKLVDAPTPAGGAGLVHFSNAEPCSWWDFAREILDHQSFGDLVIERGKTSELVENAAVRPANSVMDCSRARDLGLSLRPWRDALHEYLECPDGADLLAEAQASAEAA